MTSAGLFCEAGGFHIDPWQPVDRAVITHAHGDHARSGSRAYLGSAEGERVLRTRLGPEARIRTLEFGEAVDVNGVRVSLQQLGPKILREVPVVLVAYDLLELGGEDLREEPMGQRRASLEALLGFDARHPERSEGSAPAVRGLPFILSPPVPFESWDDVRAARAAARDHAAEGLMLKRLDSRYGVGRRRGPWWKWKVEPFSLDAVMLYAQPGHGRRAQLHTDYTFGVWDGDELVPFAKAYSGLTDVEIRELNRWIRRNTVEKFGPMRSVPPVHVFEIAFEGIRASTRHKSGLAVRFPRIARWRQDKAGRGGGLDRDAAADGGGVVSGRCA